MHACTNSWSVRKQTPFPKRHARLMFSTESPQSRQYLISHASYLHSRYRVPTRLDLFRRLKTRHHWQPRRYPLDNYSVLLSLFASSAISLFVATPCPFSGPSTRRLLPFGAGSNGVVRDFGAREYMTVRVTVWRTQTVLFFSSSGLGLVLLSFSRLELWSMLRSRSRRFSRVRADVGCADEPAIEERGEKVPDQGV